MSLGRTGASSYVLDKAAEARQQVVEWPKPPSGWGTIYVFGSRQNASCAVMVRLSSERTAEYPLPRARVSPRADGSQLVSILVSLIAPL